MDDDRCIAGVCRSHFEKPKGSKLHRTSSEAKLSSCWLVVLSRVLLTGSIRPIQGVHGGVHDSAVSSQLGSQHDEISCQGIVEIQPALRVTHANHWWLLVVIKSETKSLSKSVDLACMNCLLSTFSNWESQQFSRCGTAQCKGFATESHYDMDGSHV